MNTIHIEKKNSIIHDCIHAFVYHQHTHLILKQKKTNKVDAFGFFDKVFFYAIRYRYYIIYILFWYARV